MLAALTHLLAAAALAASWTLAGYRLLPARLRTEEEPLLVWSTALAIGAGVTSVLLTILAALHLFARPGIILVTAVVAIVALAGAREVARARPRLFVGRVERWPERLALLALGGVLLLTLLSTLAPPSSMDATVYHLQVPRAFLRARFWSPLDDPRSYQPLYVEMLFGQGLALGGSVVAALMHWILGAAAIASAGAWGRRLGGRATWAAVVFGGTALYVWEAPAAFIDLGLALWTSLAFFWATRTERGSAPAVLAGICAGLAAGSKFTGLIAATLAGLAALAVCAPDWKRGLGRLVTVGGIALGVAAPWYLRNLAFTGDPIYPLAAALFGLPAAPTLSGLTYGIGQDLLHLLSSPFDLLARGDAFDQGWAAGPVYLALGPIGALVTRMRRLALVLVGSVAGWWLIWFYSSPQTRFLLPVMPMAAGLASVAMAAVFRSGGRALRLAATAAVGIALAGALGTGALAAVRDAKVILGRESVSTYLERNSWNYTAFEAANRLLPPDANVAVDGAVNLFYLDRTAARADPATTPPLPGRGPFTHRLTVEKCPARPRPPGEPVLWEGSYPLRASRLRGGVLEQVCARLTALTAPAH
jgi:hypothetical protein